jgi:opacity protein-like surface antigen
MLLVALAGSPVALQAQAADPGWSALVFLQQSWPKQTETNRQIREINQTFGSGFQTWEDVANLNLGMQLVRQVHPRWRLGGQVDYSQGRIHGAQSVDTLAGPAALAFEQKYTIYADAIGLAQYLPLGSTGRWIPFLQAGVGLAYERDRTRLTLKNAFLDETLAVDNSGWFPLYTVGLGVDGFLTEHRRWFAEAGVSYTWSRLRHTAPATGTLAPSPTVTADTDSTGLNLWLGLGRRF